ncbi:hypothetical protein EVAR_84818_1 [Eumeta japonica]|uniref:Uncharacterized protein n=1 Tax=Eumeta variegata TaxID=151549 RepID=A0A4C1U8D3_EUMVA|nr:hypothetical protein EVAR_84818_1 [Eumeta japonica]
MRFTLCPIHGAFRNLHQGRLSGRARRPAGVSLARTVALPLGMRSSVAPGAVRLYRFTGCSPSEGREINDLGKMHLRLHKADDIAQSRGETSEALPGPLTSKPAVRAGRFIIGVDITYYVADCKYA